MPQKKPLVLFLNNIAPLYRTSVWTKYLESKTMELHFFFGKENNSGIQTIDFEADNLLKFKDRVHSLKNTYIKKKYLIWQNFKILKWLKKKPSTIIILGDFILLSNWLIILLAKIKKVEVVAKGHGMYGNEKGLKLLLRRTFLRLADKHLVYEKHGKNVMVENGIPSDKIHILFNSLDYDYHVKTRKYLNELDKSSILHFFKNPQLPTLIFIGRLTNIKKLDLIIHAAKILETRNTILNILFVGSGKESDDLKNLAKENLLEGTYYFYGQSYDEEVNSKLLATSDLCVSPGNVGLTAIHSLSYGTPVCTHSNLYYQMPEAEAIKHQENGILFEQDNVISLANEIENWLLNNPNRQATRNKCYKIIDEFYNPYYQTKVLENLIEGKKPLAIDSNTFSEQYSSSETKLARN